MIALVRLSQLVTEARSTSVRAFPVLGMPSMVTRSGGPRCSTRWTTIERPDVVRTDRGYCTLISQGGCETPSNPNNAAALRCEATAPVPRKVATRRSRRSVFGYPAIPRTLRVKETMCPLRSEVAMRR